MWGIVPAAGRGSRIQPLAFSKELLPVGSRLDDGVERPCAVSEYLVERMIRGGADKICFVISPGKSDILDYYGAGYRRRRDRLRGPAAAERPVRRDLPRGAADRRRRAGDRRPARHGLVPRGRRSRSCRTTRSPSCFPGRAARVLRRRRARRRRPRARDPGQAARTPPRTGSGAPSRCRARVLEDLHRLWLRARAARDEYFGTLVNAYLAQGGEARRRQGRRSLCRCRHAARLPRGHRRCSARPASATALRRARRARMAGGPLPAGASATCTGSAPAMNAIDASHGRDPARDRRARPLVPQHRPRRRADRARPFPRRLPGRQMAALRRRDPGRISPGKTRARHRLQRRLLLDRDEAARRRRACSAIDFDERLPRPGPLRRRGHRARHRVPQALGLRRRRARRALRPRAVHGRALPPAPPAARARPHPRARRAATCWCSSRCSAARDEVEPVEEDYDVLARPSMFDRPGYPEAALRRAPLRRRPDQLVGAEPRLRRGDAAQRRLRDRQPSGGRRSTSAAASSAPDGAGAVYPAQREQTHDRSGDDLERAEQQVALGPRDRSGLEPLRRDGDRRGQAIRAENPHAAARARRHFADRSGLHPQHDGQGVLDHVDAVAVHGFPLDWNLWQIHEWPAKLDEIRAVTDLPVWVIGGRRLDLRRRGGAGLGPEAHGRAADRPRAAHPLVQPLRPAARLGGDDAPPRGGGLVLLPPLLHGPAARGRHAEAGARGLRAITRRRSASASGSTSRTTGSTTRSPG